MKVKLCVVCGRIGDNKASNLDGIPKRYTHLFASTFEVCPKERIFPVPCKKQKFVLLPKSTLGPASYGAICLLNTIGQMMEKVIYNRLLPIVENHNGLSERQFGFRGAHFTVDATSLVVNPAEGAPISGVGTGCQKRIQLGQLEQSKEALADIGVPGDLANLVENYPSERSLWYGRKKGFDLKKTTRYKRRREWMEKEVISMGKSLA